LASAGAAGINVHAPTDGFIPTFTGTEWWSLNIGLMIETNLFRYYSKTADTQIMNGIKMSVNPADNKHVMVYDRDIMVSHVVWSHGLVEHGFEEAPFSGVGLKRIGGNIVPASGEWEKEEIPVVSGETRWYFLHTFSVPDFTAYVAALREAGLHPDDGVLLNHSRVRIQGAGADTNVAANGMLDFIHAYFNPGANGEFAFGPDLSSRLPDQWPAGLSFDGRFAPAGVERRIIGLDGEAINLTNPKRKGECGLRGKPNENFIGSLTVDMASLLLQPVNQGGLSVNRLRNTNIIGNGDRWWGVQSGGLTIRGENIGLIGDYHNVVALTINAPGEGNFNGVVDIHGRPPGGFGGRVDNNVRPFFNIWGDVPRETVRTGTSASVVFLRGEGGANFFAGTPMFPVNMTNLVIHSQKYDSFDMPATNAPHHRAFLDQNGQVRVTGPDLTGINPIHLGSNHPAFPAIMSPHEEDWINAANGDPLVTPGATLVNGQVILAPNYAALRGIDGGRYVWADLYHFQTQAARGGE